MIELTRSGVSGVPVTTIILLPMMIVICSDRKKMNGLHRDKFQFQPHHLLSLTRYSTTIPCMPFSNVSHIISRISQESWKGFVKVLVPIFACGFFCFMAREVLSTVQCRPGDPANAARHTIVREPHGLVPSQPIDKGRFHRQISRDT